MTRQRARFIAGWLSDALKIACGVVVGYGLVIVYAAVFQLLVLPAVAWLTGWGAR